VGSCEAERPADLLACRQFLTGQRKRSMTRTDTVAGQSSMCLALSGRVRLFTASRALYAP